MSLVKAIKTSKSSLLAREKDHGIDVWIDPENNVFVTAFIRAEHGGGETTVKLSRETWNSLAGVSLQMARE